MPRPIICISHSDGAEGDEVGRIVSRRLGFVYVDELIVMAAAAKGDLPPDALVDAEKRRSIVARLVEQLAVLAPAHSPPPLAPRGATRDAAEQHRALIRDVIYETAARGNAVIVAHGASLALGKRSDVLRVLVTASPETRARRLAKRGGTSEAKAPDVVKEGDAARADYLKRFYGVERELPTHYDLVVNTDVLTVEQAADVVVYAANR